MPVGAKSAETWQFGVGRNVDPERERKAILKERRGNVCENKGSAFQSPRQSRNLIENTGSCEFKADMLLKRRAGFRIQEPEE
jgi:hypothetical protein